MPHPIGHPSHLSRRGRYALLAGFAFGAGSAAISGCGPAALVAGGVAAGLGSGGGSSSGGAAAVADPGAPIGALPGPPAPIGALPGPPPILTINPVVGAPGGLVANPSVSINGAAADSDGVAKITWRNEANGTTGTAVGVSAWSASVFLREGSNTITFTAHDLVGTTSQASVVLVRTVTVIEDFEVQSSTNSGLGFRWATGGSADGRTRVTALNLPHGGAYHLTMDTAGTGFALNQAVLSVNLGTHTSAQLKFWHKGFGDELHELPASWSNLANGDGVSISADGIVWHRVTTLTSTTAWTNYIVDLGAHAANAGIALGDAFKIKFQQYDNSAIPADGFAFDDITVTAP